MTGGQPGGRVTESPCEATRAQRLTRAVLTSKCVSQHQRSRPRLRIRPRQPTRARPRAPARGARARAR
eukprot:6203713-Pleurochrysis_carterae.AAC.1